MRSSTDVSPSEMGDSWLFFRVRRGPSQTMDTQQYISSLSSEPDMASMHTGQGLGRARVQIMTSPTAGGIARFRFGPLFQEYLEFWGTFP